MYSSTCRQRDRARTATRQLGWVEDTTPAPTAQPAHPRALIGRAGTIPAPRLAGPGSGSGDDGYLGCGQPAHPPLHQRLILSAATKQDPRPSRLIQWVGESGDPGPHRHLTYSTAAPSCSLLPHLHHRIVISVSDVQSLQSHGRALVIDTHGVHVDTDSEHSLETVLYIHTVRYNVGDQTV